MNNVKDKKPTKIKLSRRIRKFFNRIGDSLLVPALSLLMALFNKLSEKNAKKLGALIGLAGGLMGISALNSALKNLKSALGLNWAGGLLVYIRLCRHLGMTAAEYSRQGPYDRDWVLKNLRPQGLEYIDKALALGKGCIILTAHFGNWEMIAVALSRLGYDMHAVANIRHIPELTLMVDKKRLDAGIKLISLEGRAARNSLLTLKKNALLGLVADEYPRQGGLEVEFFGQKTLANRGPGALAKKTGASILPTFCTRQRDNSLKLEIFPPLNICDEGQITRDMMNIFEKRIRHYPYQWAWFGNRWRNG